MMEETEIIERAIERAREKREIIERATMEKVEIIERAKKKRERRRFVELDPEIIWALEKEEAWWQEWNCPSHELVYDRDAGIAINDEDLPLSKDLAKLALAFFNHENPSTIYITDKVEVVRAINWGHQNGCTFSVTFTTYACPNAAHDDVAHPPVSSSPTTFLSKVWYPYDAAAEVKSVKIVGQ